MKYNFQKIEKKWQKKWEQSKVFILKKNSKKKKFYCLEMFPYPSAEGLHMGHALNYAIGDVYSRFKRMSGFNVLYPMGFDALGLPAENAAILAKQHPKTFTKIAIKNYIKQMKELGLSYDWSKMIMSLEPEYYKWNQYFFLKFLEKGLVYRKKAAVNWCPKCNTVLANEQVHNGKCWRHEDTDVEIKQLEQWFIKTTSYADELLDMIDELDWPDRIKIMQKNWIGKSYGTEIDFKVESKDKVILVDAINAFVVKGEGVFKEMYHLLEEFPNRKIILTNANDEEIGKFDLNNMPYEVFTLKHNPEKTNPEYYKTLLKQFDLNVEDIIYFEHNKDAVKSAESVGIKTFHYIKDKKDLVSLRKFIEENCSEKWPIFTTRPDTIYGVTFMVISAQHPNLMDLVTADQEKDMEKFLKKIKSVAAPKGVPSNEGKKELDDLEKQGVFTGSYAVNPLNKEKIPIYAGNFVVADYGSGMVMAVPAHDQRDFEFAKKYKLPIKEVIKGGDIKQRAYVEEGILINSDKFNGLDPKKAKEEITKYLEKQKLGRRAVQYKLKDWLISRQRYWGTPIPVVYCNKCGIVPLSEKSLPIKLPKKVKFGKGNPLKTNKRFLEVTCPKCKGKAQRETDTMDTFFDSSWYFLRFCDPHNSKVPFDNKKVKYWMPVDQYIGGAEHACMHLIYARFFIKALRDLGFLKFDEPFLKLFNQGMLHGLDGEKMSKSKGNVIIPEKVSKKYGMDTARLFLLSLASPDKERDWSEKGIQGSLKFLNKIYAYFNNVRIGKADLKIESKLNKTIKEVTLDIENFKYNLAIIRIRNLFDSLPEKTSKDVLEKSLKLLHPFCPHLTEELWEKINGKGFISLDKWPIVDEKKINEKFEKQDEMIGKLRSDIEKIKKLTGRRTSKVYVYVLPNELNVYNEVKEITIFAVNDKNKHDPENKSKKVKPGRPGIYLE